jgi:nicotinate phosphoribosyltransferase
MPSLKEIKAHCEEEIDGMWDEVKRFNNPHNYYVDLSEKLWKLKHDMLAEHGRR